MALVMFTRLYTFFMLAKHFHSDHAKKPAELQVRCCQTADWLQSSQSDALSHTLTQQAQVTGGERIEGKKSDLCEANSKELWENIVEEQVKDDEENMSRKGERSSVECDLRPQMNISTYSTTHSALRVCIK